MAIIKDGRTGGVTQLGVDANSYAARTTLYDATGNVIVPATAALQSSIIGVLNTVATNTGAAATDFTNTGTLAAANGSVQITGQGVYTVSASVSGTWAASLVVEGMLADSTWTQLSCYPIGLTLPYQSQFGISANGVYVITCGGFLAIRIRATAYTSGTVGVALDGSLSQLTNFVAQLGTWSMRQQDGAGNALASSTTYPVGTEQALLVRPVGPNVDGNKATYSATILGLVASATAPSDVLTLFGNTGKTLRVTRVSIYGTQTTAAVRDIALIKRSSANVGGTSTAVAAVPHDSNAAAAVGSVLAYTVNPTTLGSSPGTVRANKMFVGTAAGTGPCDLVVWEFGNRPAQALVLRGAAQGVAVNLNGVVSAGASFDINLEWSEE